MVKRFFKGKWNWLAAIIFLLISAVAISISGIVLSRGYVELKNIAAFTPSIALTLLLISGVGILIVVFASMAAGFQAINLADPTQALGLPEGSVRAVIALSLILIFAMQASFILGENKYKESHSTGISEEMLNTIPPERIVEITANEDGTYDVVQRFVELTDTGEDIANQILTTVSTLAVAVSGFYFGARVAGAAKSTAAPGPEPIIEKMEPAFGFQGITLESLKIIGKDFQMPKTAKLVRSSEELVIEILSINADKTVVTSKLVIPLEATPGKWKLILEFESGLIKEKEDAFEVKEAQAGAPIVTDIKDSEAPNLGDKEVEVTGAGFVPGSKDTVVQLRGEGYPVIQAVEVEVVSSTKIKCKFKLADMIPGERDVVVINPNKKEGVGKQLFTVL